MLLLHISKRVRYLYLIIENYLLEENAMNNVTIVNSAKYIIMEAKKNITHFQEVKHVFLSS